MGGMASGRSRALRRVGPVLAIGACGTILACLSVLGSPGVYWAEASVVLLGPKTSWAPNNFEPAPAGAIATAGVVVTLLNDERDSAVLSGADVPLYGRGIRDGVQAQQPDVGGQWQAGFDRAVIDIQAVAATREQAVEYVETTSAQATEILSRIQDDQGVVPSARITTMRVPAAPQVDYVTGSRPRALAGTVVLGVGVTAVSATLLYRWQRKRSVTVEEVG